MPVNCSALADAVERLDEGWARCRMDKSDALLRDGLIHRFETTYDLAHKILRGFLRRTAADPETVDRLSFSALIRVGAQQRLVRGEWPDWSVFREMRALAPHSYDDNVAVQVMAAVPAFLAEVRTLLVGIRGQD